MAYNFLGLVNDVNNRLNEVELTTANFATATGYFSFSRDAVNAAIRHINQEEYEWPWNHVEESEILTAGTVRYSYPNDAKTIAMNTFRIKRDASLNVGTVKLKNMSYEEWLEKYADSEYLTGTSNRSTPTHIVRTPNRELICYPNPDKAYELVYEYYRIEPFSVIAWAQNTEHRTNVDLEVFLALFRYACYSHGDETLFCSMFI